MKNTRTDSKRQQLTRIRIAECRKLCGLKQKDLAEKLNYTQEQMSYIVNGKRNLTQEAAKRMADLFNEYFVKNNVQIEHIHDYPCNSSVTARVYVDNFRNAEYIGNGIVRTHSKCIKKITSEYLLGGENEYDNIISPDGDIDLRNGIKNLLQHYGYDIKIGFCPDTLNYNNDSFTDPIDNTVGTKTDPIDECIYCDIDNAYREKMGIKTNDNSLPGFGNSFIQMDDEQVELTPLETRILLEEIEDSILSIVQRTIIRKQYQKRSEKIFSEENL